MSYSADPSTLVIDASVAVNAVLPTASKKGDALDLFSAWHRTGIQLVAPEIWLPEIVSVIRHTIIGRMISEEEGQVAVEDIFRLGVEVIPSDRNLCGRVLSWASRLGQSKAYDSFYLALAEDLGVPLWTADQRLANAARQLGAGWVHWVGERA